MIHPTPSLVGYLKIPCADKPLGTRQHFYKDNKSVLSKLVLVGKNRQSMTPLLTAPAEHTTTRGGLHTGTEAMHA
jgi:hypothetical protein